ncbi:calmodulin-like isoform X2 [Ostrea edulis]|uniref:calmodulin-like isoform X2 n=1 Tax=Ostrea edulis TaxID=37623 RepID=UPI0024AF3413|nr:calmodulin-like isoform X2 [Ostrea edulis]XP_055996329.1 calmodulin-like isoform X2 [Ostrea edulis]
MRNELRDIQSSKSKKLLRLSPKSKKKSARTKNEMESKNGDPHKKMANGFTCQENHDMKQAFDLFDKNHDGKISSDELGRVLRTLGHNYSHEEIEDMIKNADTNENGFVEFDEFVVMMRRWTHNIEVEGADGVSTSSSSSKSDKQLEAFRVFDMDGNGYIDKHELRYTMRRLGENLSDEDIKEMFKEADLNGDGLIDYSGTIFIKNTFIDQSKYEELIISFHLHE